MTESTPTPENPGTAEPTESATVVEELDEPTLLRRVEAILMTVERPITAARIAEALGSQPVKRIGEAVAKLNEFYDDSERSFRIEQVAGGFQILTLPAFKEVVATLHKTRDDHKLSAAQLETLAIVAYKQPIMRTDIEAIRGSASGEVVRSLMDRHLVKIVGRAEELGRPMLYGTTKTFLEVFGLANLKDLPKAEDIKKP